MHNIAILNIKFEAIENLTEEEVLSAYDDVLENEFLIGNTPVNEQTCVKVRCTSPNATRNRGMESGWVKWRSLWAETVNTDWRECPTDAPFTGIMSGYGTDCSRTYCDGCDFQTLIRSYCGQAAGNYTMSTNAQVNTNCAAVWGYTPSNSGTGRRGGNNGDNDDNGGYSYTGR